MSNLLFLNYIGIILCELIARMGADPDLLPRTSNFGVDYIAFSAICPECPPNFIELTFNCVRVSDVNCVEPNCVFINYRKILTLLTVFKEP